MRYEREDVEERWRSLGRADMVQVESGGRVSQGSASRGKKKNQGEIRIHR